MKVVKPADPTGKFAELGLLYLLFALLVLAAVVIFR